MNIEFKSKRILVTGAGRGIGRDLVKALAKGGAIVIAVSQTGAHLKTLKEECPTIETICVDLADWDATRSLVTAALPIDGLVNNAAIAEIAPFLEVTPGSFDRSYNVNVKSVINLSQIVAQNLKDRQVGGSIVHVSSQASQAGLHDHAVYAGTKGALDSMCKVMAVELGPLNIRVNCVNPTVVMTDMGRVAWSAPDKSGPMLSKIPLGRFSEISEVVHGILFLLSDQASMINGITLPIDGGYLAA